MNLGRKGSAQQKRKFWDKDNWGKHWAETISKWFYTDLEIKVLNKSQWLYIWFYENY